MCKKNVLIGVLPAMLLLGSTVVQARLLLSEPFDYTLGEKLDGQTPPDGMGMTGSWTATDNQASLDQLVVEGDGGVDGPGGVNETVADVEWDGNAANIPQSGHFISLGRNGHVFGHITLASSVTDTFVDGSTTWMSCVTAQTDSPWGYWPLLAVGAGELQEDRGNNAANQAIGGGGAFGDNRNGLVGAHYWNDEDGNGSYEIHISTATAGSNIPQLLVFKITWSDAGNDTVKAYQFDVSAGSTAPTEAAFDAGAVSNSANLDQSQFDTLSYGGGRIELDEIRIGTTFGDVITGTSIDPIASNPNPPDMETDVPRDVVLSWIPGEFANTHDVYFGTVFDDVKDADRSDQRGALASQGQIATTYDPGRLDFGQTYYWRVDEVNSPPDYTVYEGSVWSFTVEPVGYPIATENIIATASSSDSASAGPENTINGSGLDADDLHSVENNDMWLSSFTGAQPTWIQYEFDRIHKLHQMWVWNHNTAFESMLGFGLKDVSIEYSTDGADWKTLGGVPEFAQAPGADVYAHNTTVDFGGTTAKYVRLTVNSNWGGLFAQYGLGEVCFLYIPVWAREPSPDSGATDVDVDVTLGFRAGREAAQHDVYLSTDEQAVIDGTAPVTTVTEAGYSTSLDIASTYYWRVDEVNDAETPTTWQGEIWNLSTPEFLVVDDFESYNEIPAGEDGSNLVYLTWIDGFDNPLVNGSTMGHAVAFEPSMESVTVYDGKQSAPLYYDNSTAGYSEATANVANLQVGQDWTKHGIKALTLYFFGDPNNAVEQMYVKVNGSKVVYDGDAADIARSQWKQWSIDLASFGMDLQNVTELSIGFERSGAVGGQGVVFFDDIRLYRPAPPEPEAAP